MQQNGIALKDLHIDLTPGRKNAYWLRRGFSLNELSAGMALVLGMAGVGAMTTHWSGSEGSKPVLQTVKEVRLPDSSVQLHHELEELISLMSASSVWMNYGLENITITRSGTASYRTRLQGRYRHYYPLPRLREIAGAIGGRLEIDSDKWLVETPIFRPEPGDTRELTDILDNIEHYQRLVKGGYIELSMGPIREEPRHKAASLELLVDRPSPGLLAGIARQVERHHIEGATQKIDVKAAPGRGWQSLSIDINLLGTKS